MPGGFWGRIPRAEADTISGISPAIAVDQKAGSKNPRSTLATYTELHDSLRVLYANIGTVYCPISGEEIRGYSPTEAATHILESHSQKNVLLLAPLYMKGPQMHFILENSGKLLDFTQVLIAKGYLRVFIGEEVFHLERDKEKIAKAVAAPVNVYVVIDRMKVLAKETAEMSRLIEGIEKGYDIGEGVISVWDGNRLHGYASFPMHFGSGFAMKEDITPKHFSFNHHLGSCPKCQGIGLSHNVDVEAFIAKPNKPFYDGALAKKIDKFFTDQRQPEGDLLERCATNSGGIDLYDTAWKKLPPQQQQYLLHGIGSIPAEDRSKYDENWPGITSVVEELFTRPEWDRWRRAFTPYVRLTTCTRCGGGRLDTRILAIRLGGKSIAEVCRFSIKEARAFFKHLPQTLSPVQMEIAQEVLEETNFRLDHLYNLGLHYLNLDRSMGSLSGGEVQRLRLSTQIGNKLNDVVYVLDEPTIGLHERDTHKLLHSLKMLRDRGNTVIMVEHDGVVIRAADHLVDVGPAAGHRGGEIVFCGGKQKRQNKRLFGLSLFIWGETAAHLSTENKGRERKKTPQTDID